MKELVSSILGQTALYAELRYARDCFVSFRKFKVNGSLSMMKRMRKCH